MSQVQLAEQGRPAGVAWRRRALELRHGILLAARPGALMRAASAARRAINALAQQRLQEHEQLILSQLRQLRGEQPEQQ